MANSNNTLEMGFKDRFGYSYNGFFSFLKSDWRKVLILILCAIIYSFGQVQFLLMVAVVADGVEAISGTLSYLFPYLKPFVTVLYFVLNIPLIIFFWKKVNQVFMITTLIFLIFNAIFGFIFSIEQINDFISQKIIVLVKDGWVVASNGTTATVASGWAPFIYAILAVACCSPTSAIVWKMGSSTGSTDIIAYYLSYKSKKPVGNFLMAIGGLMSLLGILILYLCNTFLPQGFTKGINGYENFLGPQTFSSAVYILLNGFVINLIYPKYKKVKIRIDTNNIEELDEALKLINFWHPYQIKESKSGYTKNKIYSIESIVLLLESEMIIEKIKKICPDVWISIVPVSKIYGRFNYSKID